MADVMFCEVKVFQGVQKAEVYKQREYNRPESIEGTTPQGKENTKMGKETKEMSTGDMMGYPLKERVYLMNRKLDLGETLTVMIQIIGPQFYGEVCDLNKKSANQFRVKIMTME